MTDAPQSQDARRTGPGTGAQKTDTLLDGRTYHVFKYREKAILYDVGTGVVSQVNDAFLFDLLDIARRHNLPTVLSHLQQRHGQATEEAIHAALAPFRAAGLFRYDDSGPAVLRRIQKTLMNHSPRRIQLFLAQACNMACVYCYAEENGSNQRDRLMSLEVAKQAIDHLVKRSRKRRSLGVQFFGGEPLLNADVMKQVVEYAKQVGERAHKRFHFQISTNGTLLTEEIQDYIVQHDMGTLVSIDGDEETHNRQRPLRGGGPSYHLIIDKARQLNEKFNQRGRKVLKVRANVVNRSPMTAERISRLFEEMGFRYVGISGIHPRPGEETEYSFDEDALRKWRAETDRMFMDWLEMVDRTGKSSGRYVDHQIAKALRTILGGRPCGSIRCGVGRNTNAVDVDGNIFPCHRYVGLDNYILGNVKTGIDRQKILRYYRQIMTSNRKWCSACWARTKCGGPCPWEVSRTDGAIAPPSDVYCRSTREGFERALYLYVRLAERHPRLLDEILLGPGVVTPGASPGAPPGR